MKKRILSLFLVISIITSLLTTLPITAGAATSGLYSVNEGGSEGGSEGGNEDGNEVISFTKDAADFIMDPTKYYDTTEYKNNPWNLDEYIPVDVYNSYYGLSVEFYQGEWLTYEVYVPESGIYVVEAILGSSRNGCLTLTLDDQTNTCYYRKTESPTTFKAGAFELKEGFNEIKVEHASGNTINLRQYKFTKFCTDKVGKYIVMYVDDEGEFLESQEVEYGEIPAYQGETPVRATTVEFTYTFAGWNKAITKVERDVIYRATYIATKNKYMVKFVDEAGTTLDTQEVAYGETPVYSGKIPIKEETSEYTYTFIGWSPYLLPIDSDITYTPVYYPGAKIPKYEYDVENGEATITSFSYGLPGEITIPDSLDGYPVTGIGNYAFTYCRLTSITLPNSVTNIGDFAFSHCNNLKNVYYKGSEEDWGKILIDYGNEYLTNATIHYNFLSNTPKSYYIKFNLNGGSGSCAEQEVLEGSYVVVPDKPTKEGYVFTGWYANKMCSGQPYITSAGTVNQKVTNDVVLYAGWKKTSLIEWGKDTFSFGNADYFWKKKGKNVYDDYYITDEHFKKLTSDLNAYDKFWMSWHRNESFGGSCYGMSVVLSMLKQGLMSPDFMQNNAKYPFDLDYPKNNDRVASLINYYHLSQYLPSISDALDEQEAMGTIELSNKLINALLNIDKTGIPVVLGFERKLEGDWFWSGHAVVAYKIETIDGYYKIHIVDPNWLAVADKNAWPDENGDLPQIISTEPQYLYISSTDIIYDEIGGDGELSFNDGKFRLICVLDDAELYQPLNLQTKTAKKQNATLSLLSALPNEAKTELIIDFDEFMIENDTNASNVTADGVKGDLDLENGATSLGYKQLSLELPHSETYTITPTCESSDGYNAKMIFENENSFLMNVYSDDVADFKFHSDGIIDVSSNSISKKKVYLSSKNDANILGGIEFEAEAASLIVKSLGNCSYQIQSSDSLQNATVSFTDIDGNKTSVEVQDDVTEFTFTYSQTEITDVISFNGINDNESVSKTNSVIFFTNGGTNVDSVTDIAHESTISAPTEPTYDGYIFEGWYTDENYTTEWDFETDKVTGNLNLYAKWIEDPDYYKTVTFSHNDETSQIIVKNGETILLQNYTDLYSENIHNLLGWNTDSNSTEIVYNINSSITVNQDITLYPLFNTTPYTKTEIAKNDDEYTVKPLLYNITDNCEIVVAAYKGDELVAVKTKPYSEDIDFTLKGDINKIHVFVVNDFLKLKPLTKTEILTDKDWQ